MNETYRHYDFRCAECSHEFRAGMWCDREGLPKGKKCPSCDSLQIPLLVDGSGRGIMINTRGEDWTKKLPSDWKNFLGSFKDRHSKYGRTIDDHKSGVTEY